MSEQDASRGVLFGGVFRRGGVDSGDHAWLRAMLDVEAALARALERAGLAPAGAGAAVTKAAVPGNFDVADLGELAALTGNPVPALSRALARQVPRPAAGAVHRGATSQDIVDTAAMLLARDALDVIGADLAAAAQAAAALADTHRSTIMIGRTLLQQAVPITFGLMAAGWLAALDDARAGLAAVRAGRLAVQFGGAAGSLASLGDSGPRVAALLAEELALPLPALPWHTNRLRLIELSAALAGADAVLGKIARDVTLLSQSEVAEVHEGPDPGAPPRGPRWQFAPARRFLGHAAEAEPGRGHRHPRLHQTGPRPARDHRRRRRAGVPAGRRGLARGMGTAGRPAQPDRLGRVLGRRPARRPDRGRGADERQPGRGQGPAARRARHVAAGGHARPRRRARPRGRGRGPGGVGRPAAPRRPARAAAVRGTPGEGRHHPRADRVRPGPGGISRRRTHLRRRRAGRAPAECPGRTPRAPAHPAAAPTPKGRDGHG